MKGALRIRLMLFDSCLSLIETVGYSKGQPTPYSNSSKNVAFAIYMLNIQPLTTSGALFLPQNQVSDP